MSAQELIDMTRLGALVQPEDNQQRDIHSVQVIDDAALVHLELNDWVDLLQFVRIKDQWKIINVLW
jgi:hypothetical protein